jgi:hypothetical protein
MSPAIMADNDWPDSCLFQDMRMPLLRLATRPKAFQPSAGLMKSAEETISLSTGKDCPKLNRLAAQGLEPTQIPCEQFGSDLHTYGMRYCCW